MSKVTVLFFAADPLSASPDGRTPRLRLDEDVRQIRQKVRAAEHRDALEFDVRLATRTDDLLQALLERRPQVVHFSGHGGSKGLVLVSSDGRRPHHVDAAALAQLFTVFRGDIRVVVLNACFSLPQAEAIADVVGCAIGTRGEISDEAAIAFGACFYRAIAFGCSVQAAYDQARTALALEHFHDRECPALVVRPDIDPARLVLIPPESGARAPD
ncbi:MAG TPA: CHAT domain-containing protein, partial [Longimicrobium sp.]|nr:CHAT domain-containing protein [Longimicrobium sp.]